MRPSSWVACFRFASWTRIVTFGAARTEDEIPELFIPFGRPRPSRRTFHFPFAFQPICNCLGLIFLKITCICLARERTAVSVRFIRMPIAVELSPVSANLRSVSSSAGIHGREAKCSGSVIGPRALRLKANHGLRPVLLGQGICPSNRR